MFSSWDDIIVGKPVVPFLWPTKAAVWRGESVISRIGAETLNKEGLRFEVEEQDLREAGIAVRDYQIRQYYLLTQLHKQSVNASRGIWACLVVLVAIANLLSDRLGF
jgi:hypothetical protein